MLKWFLKSLFYLKPLFFLNRLLYIISYELKEMHINNGCIHLKYRNLRVLNLFSREIEQRPVYDQCDLNLITPLCGCSPNCASFESQKKLEIENVTAQSFFQKLI